MKKSSLTLLTFVLALRQNRLSTLTAALRHWVHAILPLSSCSRSTRMFLRGIMCCALVIVSVSCKSHSSVQCTVDSLQSKVSQSQLSTVNCQLLTAIRDSVIYRERTIHDTVYITKEVYRDRLEARGERQKAVRTDTVVVTEYRDRVIEHPPERYVPKFYKWCTIILWAIAAIAAMVVIGRFRL